MELLLSIHGGFQESSLDLVYWADRRRGSSWAKGWATQVVVLLAGLGFKIAVCRLWPFRLCG